MEGVPILKLSIIIPTRNEAQMLDDLLSQIEKREDIEVIVVDKDSTDGTDEVARKYGTWYLTCDGDLSTAKNKAGLAASGEWLLFLDADQHLWSKQPITDLLDWLSVNSHVRVATGPIKQAPDVDDDIHADLRELYRKHIPTLSGGYTLIRRDLFLAVNGFRPRNVCLLWWEDIDLSWRLESIGNKIHVLPFATTHRRYFQQRLLGGEILFKRF